MLQFRNLAHPVPPARKPQLSLVNLQIAFPSHCPSGQPFLGVREPSCRLAHVQSHHPNAQRQPCCRHLSFEVAQVLLPVILCFLYYLLRLTHTRRSCLWALALTQSRNSQFTNPARTVLPIFPFPISISDFPSEKSAPYRNPCPRPHRKIPPSSHPMSALPIAPPRPGPGYAYFPANYRTIPPLAILFPPSMPAAPSIGNSSASENGNSHAAVARCFRFSPQCCTQTAFRAGACAEKN